MVDMGVQAERAGIGRQERRRSAPSDDLHLGGAPAPEFLRAVVMRVYAVSPAAPPALTVAGFVYEPKYDGIRAIVEVVPGKGKDLSEAERAQLAALDLADHVEISGPLIRTRRGER